MNLANGLIDQLETTLASPELSKRAELLRHVADLFVFGSGKFTEGQIDLFDEVMSTLLQNIECAARATFGSRLSRLPDAPPRTIRLLAFDDAPEVAAPVLEHSPRLDEVTLAENARTRSQDHLLAIAGRSQLTEPVTDVLVQRGNNDVAVRTAGNGGARFSPQGMSMLVKRARDNGALAMCIWSRPDIPRETLLKLFVHASEMVRCKLEAADPRRAVLIRSAVAEASDELQMTARVGSSGHARAMAEVRSLHSGGILDEARVLGFIGERNFDKTAIALSLMSDLPIGAIERALVRSEPEQILILAKAIGLSWDTTKAILTFQRGSAPEAKARLEQCFASFFRLKPNTAKAALQFYRLRERAGQGAVH
ncbi:DUF2336 domain-containing protein [Bradyrhizobium cytisi]|uniref:DUF2336 domain-containing protein n=1 Tax=Bradyrhizobium cytisi TaxID=515489 RepID=A0A5S4WC28_9BRAD|nr:DUF2336 domain-containing protein [Bradyrhizobium cytisi]TYL78960.1 DUF2336 domain-containing protein [Bradyrhizobium cytisi]